MRRSFTCCGKIAHQDCWKRQFLLMDKPAPLGGARCDDVGTFLKKDRFTPDYTASEEKKPQEDPSKDLKCDLCHTDLGKNQAQNESESTDLKEHYMRRCPAIPGAALNRPMSRSEILERIASLSLIKKICNSSGKTDGDISRPFVFSRKENDASSSIRDGLQCSLEEPPDKG